MDFCHFWAVYWQAKDKYYCQRTLVKNLQKKNMFLWVKVLFACEWKAQVHWKKIPFLQNIYMRGLGLNLRCLVHTFGPRYDGLILYGPRVHLDSAGNSLTYSVHCGVMTESRLTDSKQKATLQPGTTRFYKVPLYLGFNASWVTAQSK